MYVAEVVYSNNFSSSFPGGTGFIGLGFGSPFWPKFTDYNSSQANYTVSNNWTDVNPFGITVTSAGPQQGVTLGANAPSYYSNLNSTVFVSGNTETSSFSYSNFQFGSISYTGNSTSIGIQGAYFLDFDTESDSDDENYYEEEVQFNLAT